jgi:hypothetical protein
MTPQQAKKLDDLSMVWSIKKQPPPEKRADPKPWSHRFQELLDFKEEYGHTSVPRDYPVLGLWARSQRVNYKLMKQGRKTPMTPEQALQLADIGFTFFVRGVVTNCEKEGTKMTPIQRGRNPTNEGIGNHDYGNKHVMITRQTKKAINKPAKTTLP